MIDYWFINPFFDFRDPEPILRDVFNGWNTGNGIFSYISQVADMPWKDIETVDETVLDIAYFGNHSGAKFCAPIVKLSIDAETGYVTETARETIAKIIVAKYFQNWKHLWETNVAVYEPIHNYDMTENRNLRTADSMAEKGQAVGNDTTQHGRTQTEMDYRYGLNTETENPKPSDKIHTSEGGSTTTNSSSTNNRNRVDAGEEEETIHRAGNIGVTTTQKLIREEREIDLFNLYDIIIEDFKMRFCILVY